MNEYFLLITLIKKSLDFFAIPEVLDPTGRVTHTPHTHIQLSKGSMYTVYCMYSVLYRTLYSTTYLTVTAYYLQVLMYTVLAAVLYSIYNTLYVHVQYSLFSGAVVKTKVEL